MPSLDDLAARRDRIRTALEAIDDAVAGFRQQMDEIWLDTDVYPDRDPDGVTPLSLFYTDESLERARQRIRRLADDLRETAEQLEELADDDR